MKLYVLTISGVRFYLWGKLKNDEMIRIDQYCKKIGSMDEGMDVEEVFAELMEYMCKELGCNVRQIIIEHIFRVNL